MKAQNVLLMVLMLMAALLATAVRADWDDDPTYEDAEKAVDTIVIVCIVIGVLIFVGIPVTIIICCVCCAACISKSSQSSSKTTGTVVQPAASAAPVQQQPVAMQPVDAYGQPVAAAGMPPPQPPYPGAYPTDPAAAVPVAAPVAADPAVDPAAIQPAGGDAAPMYPVA